MSEAENLPAETTSRAVVPVRERLITHAPSAMFDTAAFDHLNRVATVLARSGLIPKSLTHEGTGDNAKELPLDVVVARCVLLADQAQRSGADVIAYVQSTSIINGRLMHEGKLVNAIVRQRLGVHLRYRFGLWDTDHITFGPEGDETFLHGAGDRLAIRVYDRDAPEDYVEGSAGQWKTTRSGSPWTAVANWPRQLRYRGVREWARAYDPGAMLGMLADGDEDIEDIVTDVTPKGSGLMQRLKGSQEGAGFDPEHVEKQTRKRKPKDTPQDPPEQPAPDAENEAGASGTTDATSAAGPDEAEFTEVHAAPGEVYLLEGDGYNNDKRRITYKDGQRFSSVHKDSEGKHKVYASHPPAPQPTDGAPAAEPTPDTSEPATDASVDGPETEASGPSPEPADPTPADEAPAASDEGIPAHMLDDGAPDTVEEAQVEADARPPEFRAYIEAIETTAGTWLAVKEAMAVFFKSEFFGALSAEKQNQIRSVTWETCAERKASGSFSGLPDQLDDITAFRLWIEAQEDREAVIGTWDILQRGEVYGRLPQAAKDTLGTAVTVRLEAI